MLSYSNFDWHAACRRVSLISRWHLIGRYSSMKLVRQSGWTPLSHHLIHQCNRKLSYVLLVNCLLVGVPLRKISRSVRKVTLPHHYDSLRATIFYHSQTASWKCFGNVGKSSGTDECVYRKWKKARREKSRWTTSSAWSFIFITFETTRNKSSTASNCCFSEYCDMY